MIGKIPINVSGPVKHGDFITIVKLAPYSTTHSTSGLKTHSKNGNR